MAVIAGALVIEAPLFGVAALWLLAAVPAAVVTLMKDRWLMLVCGFLTLGIVWFVGAVALAPPGSPWARRFYGPERTARAAEPIRFRRSPRVVLLGLGALAAAIVVLGLFAARPAPVLGVGGNALESSVGGRSLPPCRHRGDGTWTCLRHDDQYSGTVSYRVSVGGSGCWTAVRFGPPGEGSSARLSGCVTLLDFA